MRLVHTRVFPSLFEIVVYFCIQYKRRPHFFVDAQFCFLVIFNSYVIQFGCMSPFVNRGKLVNFFTIFPEAFYHGVPSLGVYHITLSFPPCLFAIKKKNPFDRGGISILSIDLNLHLSPWEVLRGGLSIPIFLSGFSTGLFGEIKCRISNLSTWG